MLLMFQNNHTFLLNSKDLHRHNCVPGKGELRNILYLAFQPGCTLLWKLTLLYPQSVTNYKTYLSFSPWRKETRTAILQSLGKPRGYFFLVYAATALILKNPCSRAHWHQSFKNLSDSLFINCIRGWLHRFENTALPVHRTPAVLILDACESSAEVR